MKELFLSDEKYIQTQKIWDAVNLVWPNSLIKNPRDKIIKNPKVCIVYCPLYAKSELDNSKLIEPFQPLEESRVYNKLLVYKSVIEAVESSIKKEGGSMNLLAIFANKGVLLGENQNVKKADNILLAHGELLKRYTKIINVNSVFIDYEQLQVKFPKFVNFKDSLPVTIKSEEDVKLTSKLIQMFNSEICINEKIIDNKKNRKLLNNFIKMYGLEGTYWLIGGYLAFDYMIHDLVGDDGIYIAAERMGILFGISRLTPSLEKVTRIQLLV
ncbi:MAG: hypothetical protein ABH819_02910 [Patescibacteria group bacterium]